MGWAGLGKGLTEAECQLACIAEDACVFAVYKSKDRSCAYFRECSKFKKNNGLVICEKTDLSAGGEGCDYLSKFPKLCDRAYVKEGSSVTPCRSAADQCRKAA